FGPSDVEVLGRFLRRLPAESRRAVEVRHPGFFTDTNSTSLLEGTLAAADAEWVPFDTTVFFSRPPTSEAEQDAWAKKPRLPRRTGRRSGGPGGGAGAEKPTGGGRRGPAVVAGGLRGGPPPPVFIHPPENAAPPAPARRFHDDVRALMPDLDALPEPQPVQPAT